MRNIFEQLTGKPRGAINTDPLDRMPTQTLSLGRMADPPDPAEFDAAKAPTPTLSLAPDGLSAPKSDEPDYADMPLEELVSAWQKKRTDEATSAVLKRLDPTIRSAINSYAPGMERQLRVKAANLALEALSTYDPNRGANPATHVFSNLRRLSRLGAKASAIMPEPEGVVLDRNRLQRAIHLHRRPWTGAVHAGARRPHRPQREAHRLGARKPDQGRQRVVHSHAGLAEGHQGLVRAHRHGLP